MRVLHNPPSVQWETTAECNHDCVHCYNYWRKDFEKIAGMSRVKTEAEYLAIAHRLVEIKPVTVTITGGEPLLVFDKIKSSIDLLKKNGVFVTMNTNAALLNDEICQYLKDNGIQLFVSFISSNPEVFDFIANRKGVLLKVVKALDLAYDYGIKFNANIVVSKKNLDYVEETIDFIKQRYDSDYISITRVGKPINSDGTFNDWMLDHDDVGRLLDISASAAQRYDNLTIGTACPYTPCSINSQAAFDVFGYKKVCTAGKTSFAIDTDGNFKAYPRDSRLYGNILNESFEDIYEKMSEWRDGTFIPQECRGCKELSYCLGGCRVDSIPFTGRSDCLDRISDPNNLPLKFNYKSKRFNYAGKTFGFDADRIRCVMNDEDLYRLSHNRNFVMITKKLTDFLYANGEEFTNQTLVDAFDVEVAVADNIIARLLSEKIIFVH